jgi:hypothetical protein
MMRRLHDSVTRGSASSCVLTRDRGAMLLTLRSLDTVHTTVLGNLRGLPTPFTQEVLVLQFKHLDFEGPAALDHLLLAITTEPPE